jgi:hypothetical protein
LRAALLTFVNRHFHSARYDATNMPLAMKTLVALAVLLVALPATAADYPTKPDEMDKLCEVIGEAPNVSVPPRDRLWLKENCLCGEKELGCGHPGSKRLATRIKAFKKAQAERARAEAKAETARLDALKEKMDRELKDATEACEAYVACRRAKGEAGKAECVAMRDRFAADAVLATEIHDKVSAREIAVGWGLGYEVEAAGADARCDHVRERLRGMQADATERGKE